MPFLISGLNNARKPTCAPAAHMSMRPTGGGGGEGRDKLLYIAVVGTSCIGGGLYVSKLKQSYMRLQDFLFMVKHIICFLGLAVVHEIRVN